jgi:EmrB/QacA subfamily drug resistance transporter
MADAAPPERIDPALRKLITILIVGLIAVLLDTTIVNVAIDTLVRELHTTVSAIQWVNTGYLLALGVAIPISGWSVARFGAKQMWLFALSLFLLGSILAGASWNVGSLVAFRIIQGIGGGLMFPIQQTLLVRAADRRLLGRIMASVSLPAVLVPVLGPAIGGLIVSNVSWRWVFYVNVPLCAAGLIMAWRGLPTSEREKAYPKLDTTGLALLCPGLAAVLYALTEMGSGHAIGSVLVAAPGIAGVLLLGLFVGYALRTSGHPLIDLRLFRLRAFTSASSLLFLSGLSLYGAMLLLPLYYQQVRGESALMAGLMIAPQGLGSLLTRAPVGKLTDRLGARPVVLGGVVLAAAGTLAFTQAGAAGGALLLGLSLVVRGAGLSAANVAVMAAAYQGVEREEIPHASSVTRILMQVGGSFGTAVTAVVLQQQLTGHPSGNKAHLASAFDVAFWWAFGFTMLAFVPALLMPRRAREAAESAVAS